MKNKEDKIFITMANCSIPMGFPKMPIDLFITRMEEIKEIYPNYRIDRILTKYNETTIWDNINIEIVRNE